MDPQYQQHHQQQQQFQQQPQFQQQQQPQFQQPTPPLQQQQPQYPPQGHFADPKQQEHQQQQHVDPNQQYQPQQQMQPAMVVAQAPPQVNEWNASLCTCSPCGGCLLATCLPCILVGKTSERLVDPSLSRYDVFNPECLIMGGISYVGLGFVYAMIKRMEIRERFGIKGSGAGDFCASYWCACCVILQNDNEVRSRVGEPGKVPVAQGYQQNQGMTVPAPAPAAVKN